MCMSNKCVCITLFNFCSAPELLTIIHMCDVIKKNESEVSCNMLLVSEVLVRFNICKCLCKTRHLSQVHASCYRDLTKCDLYLNIVRFTSGWFKILLILCFKIKNNLKPVPCRYRLPTRST